MAAAGTDVLYGDMAEYKTSERFLMDSKASFDGKQVKQELMCSGLQRRRGKVYAEVKV